MSSEADFGSDATLGADATEAGQGRELADARETQREIGRYLIVDELGRGAMGMVFRAYDPQLDRRVALKLIRGDPASEAARVRLLREAQAMARLQHPNVIAVHDAGVHGDDVYVAMELFEGVTLRDWMAQEQPWRTVVEVFLRAAQGLSAAHRAGLVHRDFKPGNAMVSAGGDVRVLDFGLARVDQVEELEVTGGGSITDARLTHTGHVVGTPAYMAPEQWQGGAVDAAADQFAFCVSLYEALWGHRPFEADSVEGLMTRVLEGTPAPPRRTGVPGWLHDVVHRGLALRPEDRFASMDALAAALRRGLVGRRRSAAVAGVAAVGIASAVALGLEPEANPCPDATPQLEGVWARGEVEAGMGFARVAHAPAHAGELGTRARETLDAYAQGWSEAYREACEATRVHAKAPPEVLERRLACLDRHRRSLGAVAAVLLEPDLEIIRRSAEIVETLEPHARCLEIDALAGRIGRGPAAVEQVVLVKLDEASLASAAGRFDEGLELTAEALAEAETLELSWLVAKAQSERAGLLSESGKQGEALALGRTAITTALRTDDPGLQGEHDAHVRVFPDRDGSGGGRALGGLRARGALPRAEGSGVGTFVSRGRRHGVLRRGAVRGCAARGGALGGARAVPRHAERA